MRQVSCDRGWYFGRATKFLPCKVTFASQSKRYEVTLGNSLGMPLKFNRALHLQFSGAFESEFHCIRADFREGIRTATFQFSESGSSLNGLDLVTKLPICPGCGGSLFQLRTVIDPLLLQAGLRPLKQSFAPSSPSLPQADLRCIRSSVGRGGSLLQS